MVMASRPLTRLLTGLSALVLAPRAPAQVTITCDLAQVTSRVPCTLTVAHGDRAPRTWRWRVVGLEDAAWLLEPLAPDRVRVKTPVTLVERPFTVVAEDSRDPSVAGTFVLRITPNPAAGSSERALVEGLFPDAFTPSLRPLLGRPERISTGAEDDPVRGIAFCDDAAMGALDRCWILARDTGLQAFTVAGEPVAIPGFPFPPQSHRTCVAVAAMPPGPGELPAGAPRLVFCEQRFDHPVGVWIYALEPDGRRRLLAGGHGVEAIDGPGDSARFPWVVDLALDRRGRVQVCPFLGPLRTIGLDGRVSTLVPRDPGWPASRERRIHSLAPDPATGDLYAADSGWVVRIAPDGQLTPVLGSGSLALAASRALPPPATRPWHPKSDLQLHQLALHGRELLITSSVGLDAFHLDSRRLVRILAYDEHLQTNRMGPVPYLNPHLPASRCAAVRSCGPLALTREAMSIVAVGQGLAELELPGDPITTIMDPPRNRTVSPVPSKDARQATPPEGAPEPGNLWPGPALEAGAVRADGTWETAHWRSAAPGQRFTGQGWVEARGLSQGRARIGLLFADGNGWILGQGQAAGAGDPDGISAPLEGLALLSTAGTAPAGTARVAFRIQVEQGSPDAFVAFLEVAFRQVP